LGGIQIIADLGIQIIAPGSVGTTIWRILYGHATGYGFAFGPHRAGVGGNDDWADDAEEAGSIAFGTAPRATGRDSLGTAARETNASRAAVPIV